MTCSTTMINGCSVTWASSPVPSLSSKWPGSASWVLRRQPLSLIALINLIESSLVRPAPKNSSGEIRLLLLEPIREYALEQLERSREADVARVRHALAYLELAERAAPEMNGPDQGAWLERLERDDGNLRVALRSLIDRGDVEGGLRFSAALSWFWWVRGHAREGLDQLREVLALHSVVPDNSSLAGARAQALAGAGLLAYQLGEFEVSRVHADAALAIHTELNNKRGVGFALTTLGRAPIRGRPQPCRASLSRESRSL